MAGQFTPARVVINKPVPGPKGDPGEGGGGPHTHPEYEHAHPYAAEVHTHPEYEHDHPYAADDHNHDGVYALVHAHPYASDTHNHDSAYSATGHNHDGTYAPTHAHPYASDTHNHDGVYAPTHAHPYADADHGAHLSAGQLTDLTDGGATTLHTHAGGGLDFGEAADIVAVAFGDTAAAGASGEVADASHRHAAPANPVTAHEAASDPHTGYLKESDVTGAAGASAFGDTAAAGSAATAAKTDHRHSREANPVTAHEAASDPHTGDLKESDANWVDLTDGGATTLHSHAGGGGGGTTEFVNVVASNQANSTVTPAVITELTEAGLAAGTYVFKVWIAYQAAATTTGLEMFANFTGTVSRFISTWYSLTTGGAAATGVLDQATTLTAQMMEGKGQRAKDVASGPTQGVDTANADQFAVIEGLFIATGSGDFQVKFRSEVAASAVTIMPGTTLELRKVA
jgi:hypothetical protein